MISLSDTCSAVPQNTPFQESENARTVKYSSIVAQNQDMNTN